MGQEGYEVFDLGEIYVSAEKLPASKEVTVTTEITAEEIKATNSRTVAEALTYVPGVIVSSGRKNEPSIQIRGLNQSRALSSASTVFPIMRRISGSSISIRSRWIISQKLR